MKLTEKAKRYLLVLGGILLCAGLLVAIWFQLKPEAVPEERFEAETGGRKRARGAKRGWDSGDRTGEPAG